MLNPMDIVDDGTGLLTHMEDGQTLWPPRDPVHLRGEAYSQLAEAILDAAVFGGLDCESKASAKRLRLESTIVCPSGSANQASRLQVIVTLADKSGCCQ